MDFEIVWVVGCLVAQGASVGLQEGHWPDSPEGFLLIHIVRSSVRLAQSASVGLQGGQSPDSPIGFPLTHFVRSSVRLLGGVSVSGVEGG